MMEKIHLVRRRWMEAHFAQWDSADRDKLIDLMDRMLVRDDERDN